MSPTGPRWAVGRPQSSAARGASLHPHSRQGGIFSSLSCSTLILLPYLLRTLVFTLLTAMGNFMCLLPRLLDAQIAGDRDLELLVIAIE